MNIEKKLEEFDEKFGILRKELPNGQLVQGTVQITIKDFIKQAIKQAQEEIKKNNK